MKTSEILATSTKILTSEQREFYFENGYLLLPGFVSQEWLDCLQAVTAQMVEESRTVGTSDQKFVLEAGHSAASPRLRRLTSPVAHHPAYWEFASNSVITDLAEDLLGPGVKFHHSKLNFKAEGGGVALQWHQDFPFMPHTNSCVLTIGLYLADVDESMAPMAVVPGSHKGEIFPLYNDKEQWVGAIQPRDLPRAGIDRAVPLMGKAGAVTVHNARIVHGSRENNSPRPRPLLLNMFSSADAMPISENTIPSQYHGRLVRGRRAKWIELDAGPVMVPPGAGDRPSGIFAAQQYP
jgi:ectoine hydroxylase